MDNFKLNYNDRSWGGKTSFKPTDQYINRCGFLDTLYTKFENQGFEFGKFIDRGYIFDDINHDEFPMISYEETSDSNVTCSPDESLFLNDSDYEHEWFYVKNDWGYVALICMKSMGDTVHIDAFEINKQLRGHKYGKVIINAIEDIASNFDYDKVTLSPYDTDAMNFWNHMRYSEEIHDNVCYFSKEL